MSARAISKLILSAVVVAPETDLKCCRRSELPLYTQEPKPEECQVKPPSTPQRCSFIEKTIRSIRLNIDSAYKEVKKYENMGSSYIQEGVDNAQWLVDYLGDEENPAPKGPAIAIGGLTGFIFALRGGFFKKIIYTSIGALGMASVCYPKEAKEYGGIAIDEGHNYATIGYNFIYGVKKGDPPLELPSLPKLPGSVSEGISMISDFVKTTSASLTEQAPADDAAKAAAEEKKVRDKDPCRWIELQKRSGAYQSVVRAEAAREAQETADDDDDECVQSVHEVPEEDECCPCHLGSCMHAGVNKDDCPDQLPYPPPNCPDPPKKMTLEEQQCQCGLCCDDNDED